MSYLQIIQCLPDELRPRKKGQKLLFEQLAAKVETVEAAYPALELVPLVVTHCARPKGFRTGPSSGRHHHSELRVVVF